MHIADIIDLDRYPLHRPDSPEWQATVDKARADLAAEGMFDLQGFLRPAALAQAVADLSPRFASESFLHARRHNIYFRKTVEGLPPDHPALTEFETVNRTLCGDQIGGVTAALYDWPEFARFLAATMDKPALFTMDDPLARVNAMQYGPGESLNWHFDRSEFTTTLLLQAPQAGGAFEYRTGLRSDRDANHDGVARLLRGEDPDKKAITLTAGALNVFRGRNTAHRVTPVQGDRSRIIAVFSFYDRPGVRFSAEEQQGFYGRTAA
jgi:2OG-Fe(II) oxygenase superfamily